jgi:hypothetical protein
VGVLTKHNSQTLTTMLMIVCVKIMIMMETKYVSDKFIKLLGNY